MERVGRKIEGEASDRDRVWEGRVRLEWEVLETL